MNLISTLLSRLTSFDLSDLNNDAKSEIVTNQNPSSFKLTHLFFITAVFALFAGIRGWEIQLYQVGAKSHGADAVGLDFEQSILITCAALFEGWAFAGGLFLSFNYVCHKRTLQHPGHWLLALSAISAIFYLIERCLYMTLAYFDGFSFQYQQFYFWTPVIIQILIAAAWITVTVFVAKRFGKIWWLTFGLFTTFHLASVASLVVGFDLVFTQFVLLMATMGSLWQDVRQGVARDWLHWFGVLFIVFNLGLVTIGTLILRASG